MRETFRHEPSEIGRARRHAVEVLHSWGRDAQVVPIELAVSELVSNALIHGTGAIQVDLFLIDEKIRLEIHDGGNEDGRTPSIQARDPHTLEPGGCGLRFVDQVAEAWGADQEAGHTRVWMERRGPPDDIRP